MTKKWTFCQNKVKKKKIALVIREGNGDPYESDDEVLRRRIGHGRADGFGGADDQEETAPDQSELADQDGSVVRDGVEEHDRVEDVLLDHAQPEQHLFEPHEFGGFVDLELAVLVRANQRMRETEPRQLFPQLRDDVVEEEAHAGRHHPHHFAEDRLQFGEDGAAVDAEDQHRHHHADDGVRTQPRHDRFLHFHRQRVTAIVLVPSKIKKIKKIIFFFIN